MIKSGECGKVVVMILRFLNNLVNNGAIRVNGKIQGKKYI